MCVVKFHVSEHVFLCLCVSVGQFLCVCLWVSLCVSVCMSVCVCVCIVVRMPVSFCVSAFVCNECYPMVYCACVH